MFRLLGVSFKQQELPEGAAKVRLILAINSSSKTIPLTVLLKTIGLSPAGFHAWQNKGACGLYGGLTDRNSFARTKPTQLTSSEIQSFGTWLLHKITNTSRPKVCHN